MADLQNDVVAGQSGHVTDHNELHDQLRDLQQGVTKANLRSTDVAAGDLARVTDDVRGLWMYQGSQWFSLTGEVIMAPEFGFDPSNSAADNDTALSAAIGEMGNGDRLFLGPPGTYAISSTFTWENLQGVHVFGAGGGRQSTNLEWNGSASGNPIRIFGCRDSIFENFYITASTQIGNAVQLETRSGSTSTANLFRRVYVQGQGGGCTHGFVTTTGTGGDANNDHMQWEYCFVQNVDTDAWRFEGSQSKVHTLIHCQHNTCAVGVHQVHGSFRAFNHAGGSATDTDFRLEQANDYAGIHGGRFEGSNRFLMTSGPSSARWPIYVENVYWQDNSLNVDNVAIDVLFRGPFVLTGCQIGNISNANDIEIWWRPGADPKNASFVAIGNTVATTAATPFAKTHPNISLGNATNSSGSSHTTIRNLSMGNDFKVFTDGDATPSVASGNLFKTANTGATTITDLDSGVEGQEVKIVIADTNTTIDFTGTNLKGNGGADWSPTTNDHMTCVHDGTSWFCDISDNTA